MAKKYRSDTIFHKIMNKVDIAFMVDDMIKNNKIHPKAIKNLYAVDDNGNVLIDVDLSKDNYTHILCPFHDSKNGDSTSLDRRKNTMKCFNGDCFANKSLNAIALYMILRFNVDPKLIGTKIVGKEYFLTLKELAAFLDIEFTANTRELTEEEKEEQTTRRIREQTALLYHQALSNHKRAEEAKKYLLEVRGFQYGAVPLKDLMEKYKIGFAPGWDYAYNRLKGKFSLEELVQAGVVRTYTKEGKELVRDFLSNSVTVPYFSQSKIVNLYGRAMGSVDDRFRHLRLAGGVDVPINFDNVIDYSSIIIVEGELSWLSLLAMNFPNTLGNRGTNGLSDEHLALLKMIREKTDGEKCAVIYLAFDPDKAGIAATVKTGQKLVDAGFFVQVIELPSWVENGKTKGDPNDFLLRYQQAAHDEFASLMKQSLSYEAFMIKYIMQKNSLNSVLEERMALRKARRFVANIPKDELLFIAKEVSSALSIDADQLLASWIDIRKEQTQKPASPAAEDEKNPGLHHAAKYGWLFLTQKEETKQALTQKNLLDNVVLIQDASAFKKEVSHYQVHSIVFDHELPKDLKTSLFYELPDYKYSVFIPEAEDVLSELDQERFSERIQFVKRPASSTSQSVS